MLSIGQLFAGSGIKRKHGIGKSCAIVEVLELAKGESFNKLYVSAKVLYYCNGNNWHMHLCTGR